MYVYLSLVDLFVSVSRDFKRESMQTCFENCANSLLGSDHTSWGWDVSTCKLWHGGRCLSSYPVIPGELVASKTEINAYSRINLPQQPDLFI